MRLDTFNVRGTPPNSIHCNRAFLRIIQITFSISRHIYHHMHGNVRCFSCLGLIMRIFFRAKTTILNKQMHFINWEIGQTCVHTHTHTLYTQIHCTKNLKRWISVRNAHQPTRICCCCIGQDVVPIVR